nr:cell division cycle protein 48 homolog isoform X1 [Tanacetum cinerariifolium]
MVNKVVELPSCSRDDIGGLKNVKRELQEEVNSECVFFRLLNFPIAAGMISEVSRMLSVSFKSLASDNGD